MEHTLNHNMDKLQSILKNAPFDVGQYEGYNYFLKGDVSGIQDFIFSVKSRRASRTLKGRSFFIHALSEICIRLIMDRLGHDNVEVFYNGGGNFYLLLKSEFKKEIQGVQDTINRDCADQEFYVSLSTVKIEGLENNFLGAWKKLQKQSNRDKLRRFENSIDSFKTYRRNHTTEPVAEPGKETKGPFEKFAHKLIKAKSWSVETLPAKSEISIGDSGATVFDCRYKFSGTEKFTDVVHKLPVWDKELLEKYRETVERVEKRNEKTEGWEKPSPGNIIDFEYFAEFAYERTGTRKLGILKMDVDNLGQLFQNINKAENARKLSRGLKYFFGDYLKKLLEGKFAHIVPSKEAEKKHTAFSHNIYTVFSGGDDCFFIGAWDAIFEFAARLQQEFSAFAEQMKAEVPGLNDITLSAGLVVVGAKFPVSRFAKLAEHALEQAKNKKHKKTINVFDHNLLWSYFYKARTTAHDLASLILQKGENRAILERLQRESVEFERIANDASTNGIVRGRSAWRLLYSVKRTASKNNLKDLEKISKEYADVIVDALVKGKAKVASKLYRVPVAARWAEFLTRISNKKSLTNEQKKF